MKFRYFPEGKYQHANTAGERNIPSHLQCTVCQDGQMTDGWSLLAEILPHRQHARKTEYLPSIYFLFNLGYKPAIWSRLLY